MSRDKIHCVTSFGKIGMDLYANEMVSSFIVNWPADVDLMVFLDDIDDRAKLPQAPNVHYHLLDDPDLLAFKARNTNDPRKHGLATFDDRDDSNKFVKNKEGKWKFQYDAIRFCHKVFAMAMGARLGGDLALWIDGDVRTFAPVSRERINSWLPQGKFAGYLDRPKSYTETGFHVFDMKHDLAERFFDAWLQHYRDDSIFSLAAWTDCHTYDSARRKFDQAYWHDLSPKVQGGGNSGHVFINGELGEVMDHMKGKRKLNGKSNRGDLFVTRSEDYWRNAK